jgi:hypothetical protein
MTIVPVGTAHVGCTVTLAVGVAGTAGTAVMTTFDDNADIQPDALVTVKLYVLPSASPEIVVLVVFPAIDPGLMVQLPEGKPLKTTLPVGVAQVGCVMVPTTGATGNALTAIG